MAKYNAQRKPGKRREGKSIFILTEGKVSEVVYLNYLKAKFRIPDSLIKVKPAKSPQALKMMDEIINKKEKNIKNSKKGKAEKFDEFWVVFDTENLIDEVDEAVRIAKNNNIYLAISDISFEIWLLLHFKYSTKSYNKPSEAVNDLNKYLKDYKESNKCPDMDILFPKVESARANSQKLRKDRINNNIKKTFTDMDILVDNLINESDRAVKSQYSGLITLDNLSFNNILSN